MYGVEQFVAVLNPPQAAILAVGAIEERPVARDGELVVRPMMTMTLTCDHRTIDGATAADFLRTREGVPGGAGPDAVSVGDARASGTASAIWPRRGRSTATCSASRRRSTHPGQWLRLRRDDMEIALWEAQGDEGGVASVDVADVRAEVDRLKSLGVEVGVIVELHGHFRIVDVFDPDGNRIQLTQELA